MKKKFFVYETPRLVWLLGAEEQFVLCYSLENPGTSLEDMGEDNDSGSWDL